MLKFAQWCVSKKEAEGEHEILVLSGVPTKRQLGIENCAVSVPSHYGNPTFAAELFKRLGKKKAAAHLQAQLGKYPVDVP